MDLDAIRERLARANKLIAIARRVGMEPPSWATDYVRDVAALLAEIDGSRRADN